MGEIVSRERLTDVAVRARASGQSIALASGGFDPFHVGHVRYLQASARQADVLVVAVWAEPAMPLAGHVRFILEPEHRATLITALRCVDVVTVLEERALVPLIDTLKPDVYCQDVCGHAEPGANVAVAVYGGRVAVVGDPTAPSTEDVLARIASGGAPGRTPVP